MVDDETWEITDVLVDSRQWLPGKLLLISPDVIERIDWPRLVARFGFLGARVFAFAHGFVLLVRSHVIFLLPVFV